MYKFIVFFAVTFLLLKEAVSQVQYPHPLKYVNLVIESRQVQMAYMYVKPPIQQLKKPFFYYMGKTLMAIIGRG